MNISCNTKFSFINNIIFSKITGQPPNKKFEIIPENILAKNPDLQKKIEGIFLEATKITEKQFKNKNCAQSLEQL